MNRRWQVHGQVPCAPDGPPHVKQLAPDELKQVQPLFVTVDPARDDAQLLASCLRTYVGRRSTDNANTIVMPVYTLLDLATGYRIGKNLGLALWLRNTTDKLYALSSDGGSNRQLLLGEPRSIETVLSARF